MKNKQTLRHSIIILLLAPLMLFAQMPQARLDSLEAELQKINTQHAQPNYKVTLKDTNTIKLMLPLCRHYVRNNPAKGVQYTQQVLNLSDQLHYDKGLGIGYLILGEINTQMGNYPQGMEFYNKALKVKQKVKNDPELFFVYMGIGTSFHMQNQLPEALKHYFQALKTAEAQGNQFGIAACYGNLGLVYMKQENPTEALANFQKAAEIQLKTNEKHGLAMTYDNIGGIYEMQNKPIEALKYHEMSLKLREQINDKYGIATARVNMVKLLLDQKRYKEATEYSNTALKFFEEIGDPLGLTSANASLGDISIMEKNYDKATAAFNKVLSITKNTNNLMGVSTAYASLARVDSLRGNFQQAFANYKLHINYRDSVINNESAKKIMEQQVKYDFEKKEVATKAETDAELNKQRLIRNGLIGILLLSLLFAGIFFRQRNEIKKGKHLSDELLLNILPAETAEELKQKGTVDAKMVEEVTVLFTDFKDFTTIAERLSPSELVNNLHQCFTAFDHIMEKHGLEKIKTIGDAYMAVGGLPSPNTNHALDIAKAAIEIRDFMAKEKMNRVQNNQPYFEIRIGIHTGPVVAGIVGIKKYAYDIWGDTVNIASRMEQNSEVGKINISNSTYRLVKNQFACEYRGKIEAKNKGEIDMYFIENS